MEQTRLDGALYKQLICAGAVNLQRHEEEINDLNVFPIPDGDTGSNICIANLFGFHDLEHNNMRIGHGAVVDQIVLTHQRVTFVSQDLIFCHVVPP